MVGAGLYALAWSSDKFVLGAAALARNLGVSPFIVGMVVVGFGTSVPELLVSTFSGISGHTNLSLGNAYGSCIFNIAGILGVSALIRPMMIKASIVKFATPLLLAVTTLSWFLLADGTLTRANALILLGVFALVMCGYCIKEAKSGSTTKVGGDEADMTMPRAVLWTLTGLSTMIIASHALVWGSVDFAKALGVSDLVIGLTIVAIGTSVPELASAIAASRRGAADMVLGNIVGSNFFNMLAVVGIAGTISPSCGFSRYVLERDMPLLVIVTGLIIIFGINFRRKRAGSALTRSKGAVYLAIFISYMVLMIFQEVIKNG